MQVEEMKIVTIDYTLKDGEGNILDTSKDDQPLSYLHGKGQIIPGLEEALEGRKMGDQFSVEVPAEKAYGAHDPEKLIKVEKEYLADIPGLKEGMPLQMDSEHGLTIVTVREIHDDHVIIDANHPFVDQTLYFDVDVVSVREASEEELAHGHSHGDCGCGGHEDGDCCKDKDDHECCGGHGHEDGGCGCGNH